MSDSRIYVLTIGGFDPCNGAGITADVKTAEAIGVYALAVQTGVTIQNEAEIRKIYWHSLDQIKEQIDVLVDKYYFEFVKVSLTNGLRAALEIVTYISKVSDAKIIWDPIMQSSSGFDFYQGINQEILKSILEKVFLATPNWNEMKRWEETKSPTAAASKLSKISNIYLKGGHNQAAVGVDYLFHDLGKIKKLETEKISRHLKHGSGCVFATAYTSYLAQGSDLLEAGKLAKTYTFNFLESSTSVLGIHINGNLNDTNSESRPQKSNSSQVNTVKLEESGQYHISNKANDGELIFKEPENYIYFTSLIAYHIKPVADILAYCLLPNHFHLIIKMKSGQAIPKQFKEDLSLPFSNLFYAYTKAFNKMFDRSGSLFGKNFKKNLLESDEEVTNSILYVHTNPTHHDIGDYKTYAYSSYQGIIDEEDRLVDDEICYEWFENTQNYIYLHDNRKLKIELD